MKTARALNGQAENVINAEKEIIKKKEISAICEAIRKKWCKSTAQLAILS